MSILQNKKPSFASYIVGLYLFSVPVFSYSAEIGLTMIPQIIGTFLMLYAVYELLKTRTFNRNISIIFYSLFTIWSLISFPFSGFISQNDELLTLIKVTIITVSASFLIRNYTEFISCLSIFFISIFLTFWLNREDIFKLGNLSSLAGEDRFAGTFVNANTAAIYGLAVIWSGFILLFNKNRNLIIVPIIMVGIILAGYVIIISGSRKGLLGLGFMSIAVAWVPIKKFGSTYFRKILIAIILLCLVYAILKIIYISPYFFRVQTMFQGESSADLRIIYFKEAIYVWRSSLKNIIIGVGIDNFRLYSSLNDYSHSTISETLVDTGIIGFGLYYTSFFSIFSSYIQVFKLSKSEIRINVILVFIFLLTVLFFNTAAVLYDDKLFMPLLGIISAYGITMKQTDLSIEKNTTY